MKLKYILCLSMTLSLIGCGGSNDNENTTNNKSFKVTTYSIHCGNSTPFSNGEVLLYSTTGEIAKRIPLSSSGTTNVESESDTVSFAVYTVELNDDGQEEQNIVVLNNVANSSTYTFGTSDQASRPTSCECKDINVYYGNYVPVDISTKFGGKISQSNGMGMTTLFSVCGNATTENTVLGVFKSDNDYYSASLNFNVAQTSEIHLDPELINSMNRYTIHKDSNVAFQPGSVTHSLFSSTTDLYAYYLSEPADLEVTQGLHFAEFNDLNTQSIRQVSYIANSNYTKHYGHNIYRASSNADEYLLLPPVSDFETTFSDNTIGWSHNNDVNPIESYTYFLSFNNEWYISVYQSAESNETQFKMPALPAEYNIQYSSADYSGSRLREYEGTNYKELMKNKFNGMPTYHSYRFIGTYGFHESAKSKKSKVSLTEEQAVRLMRFVEGK